MTWQEDIALADGSVVRAERRILLGPDAFFRPGQGGITESWLRATLPRLGKVEFHWQGPWMPVSFDVIEGAPWVVMPIGGLEACEKYGNPAESMAAFRWSAGQWTAFPYAKAPQDLRHNVLRAPPFNREPYVDLAAKRGYERFIGEPLAARVIPQHVKWDHACHRINPPPDPAYQRGLEEFRQRPRIALSGRIVATREEPMALDYAENQAMMGSSMGRPAPECKGRVDRVQQVMSTTRTRDGGSSGVANAWQIVLAGSKVPPPSIFMPESSPTPRTHIARVSCSESLIRVVLREESNVVQVVAYDPDGAWRNAWRIVVADLQVPDNRWGTVVAFDELPDRFRFTIGDYTHHSGGAGATVATLGRRFDIEAPKQ